MPIGQYAADFRRSLFRVDPMMPILGVIAGAAANYLAAQRRRQGPRVRRACIYRVRGGGVHCYRRADQLQIPPLPEGRAPQRPNTVGPFGGAFMR